MTPEELMSPFKTGDLVASTINKNMLWRVERVNRKSLTLASRTLAGSYPHGGSVKHRISHLHAEQILRLVARKNDSEAMRLAPAAVRALREDYP